MRRIFIAVPISNELQAGIIEWQKYYLNLPVRWLEGKNLHITLVPPWYEDNIESVIEIITKAIVGIKPFDIVFKRVNYGPNPKAPRMIWAENMAPKPLIELFDRLHQSFRIERDYRQWKMHITLARFRPETFSSFPVKKLDEEIFWPEKIKSVVLMQSHLTSVRADYVVLKEIYFENN